LFVTVVTAIIGMEFLMGRSMATNAERQAAWRERQKELGAEGRKWRVVDLTRPERDFLQRCLELYRRNPTAANALVSDALTHEN
jgi:hypothetical protein